MDVNNIKFFLKELRDKLLPLKNLNHKEGEDELNRIKKQIKMTIRRIYPNPEKVEKSLFSSLWVGTDVEEYLQKDYLDDIEECVVAIETISTEIEVFGIDDFTPVKEKTETTTKVGLPKFFSHEVKKTK
jgi:hypothetical protein